MGNLDLPIEISNDFDVDSLLKTFKISFKLGNNLLENLFLIVDIEKIFHLHEVVVLINIKQFLNSCEIIELEKYAIYNKVYLMLVDSRSYGVSTKYEKKLLIDTDLSECVL